MVVTQTQLFFGQANTYPTAYSDILEFQNISKFSILPNLNPNFGNWEDFDKHPIHQTYYIDILKRISSIFPRSLQFKFIFFSQQTNDLMDIQGSIQE